MSQTYPVGDKGGRATIEQIMARSDWLMLDPTMAARLQQLIIASNGLVGFGGGGRTTEQQTGLFLDRHHPDPNGPISYNGQKWSLNPGASPAAPPGLSYHEPTTPDGKSLAVDLTGDMGWLAANAGRFGLTSSAVKGEPWHVQPLEVPAGRGGYDPANNVLSGSPPTTTPDGSPMPAGTTGASPQGVPTAPLKLPSDAQLINNGQGLFAVFNVHGVNISYGINWWDGSVDLSNTQQSTMTPDQWTALNVVNADNAEKLRDIPKSFGSYSSFFDSILNGIAGPGNPASTDPSVLRVIAEKAGRFDMSEAEFANKLSATAWYQTHNANQLAWNGLSEADKAARRADTAVQMSAQWKQFTGYDVSPDDPRIANYLDEVASGKTGIGSWTESVVKAQAKTDAQSPYSRQITAEDQARKQAGVDIENTAQRVRDLANRWGVQWSQPTYQDWAQKITSKDASEADLINELKTQAQVLYPWKSPEVETQSAAQPWIQTYNRVLERQGDIFDPKVQSALQAGKPTWQFEQELKQTPDWLQTKNGEADISSAMGNVGRMMGYV